MKLHKMVSAIFVICSCASCSSSQTPHETAKQGTFSSSGARRQGVQTGRDAWNFDKDAIGGIPKGFTPATGEWKIVKDGSSPSLPHALAQEAESSRSTFNVILATQTNYANVDLSVKIKAVAGGCRRPDRPGRRARVAGKGHQELLHCPL